MNRFAKQGRHRDTDAENKRMDTKQGKGWGGMNWEVGIDIYTLIGIKQITNKNLLYKKINKIQNKKINYQTQIKYTLKVHTRM